MLLPQPWKITGKITCKRKCKNDMETGIIRGLSNWVGRACRDFGVWGLLEVKRFSLIELQLVGLRFY